MAAPNSAPVPHDFTPQEEVAWEQGVLTPYIHDAEQAVTNNLPTQRTHKPHRTGHVREYTSDSELDPYWATDDGVPGLSGEELKARLEQLHKDAEKRHIAELASDPELPMFHLAAIIRARAEKRERRK